MSRDEPGRVARGPLPAEDLPSAEVLDELLRAFSADSADAATLDGIDLTSPEVEDLLAPTSPTPPPEPVASPAEAEAEVEVDGETQLEAPTDPDPLAEAEDGEEPESAPEVEGATDAAGSQGSQGAPPEPEIPDAGEEVAPENEGTSSGATTRTIQIDASDDPPDAVYLAAGDPLLAASAGARGLTGLPPATDEPAPAETTVFIDDQVVGEGETITLADASKATQIEPRLRERRIAVKRAVGRKRLRWVFGGLGLIVVLVAGLAVLGSGLFAIDEVRVDGAVYTDPVALQAVVDDLEGTPVLRADTDRAEQELEAIPWVASARVDAEFPNRATIELRERTPVAVFQAPDQRFRVVDIEARVLDVLDAQPVEYLLVTSPEATDLVPGQFAPQGFVAASNLVTALTPELRALAGSVSVSADGSDLRLILTDGREVRFGQGRDLVSKLVRLQTKLDDLTFGGFQYVDVSTNEITTG